MSEDKPNSAGRQGAKPLDVDIIDVLATAYCKASGGFAGKSHLGVRAMLLALAEVELPTAVKDAADNAHEACFLEANYIPPYERFQVIFHAICRALAGGVRS